MLVDLHVHTAHSIDATGTPEEYAAEARARGVETLAFVEHVDFEPTDPGYGAYSYERAVEDVARARATGTDALLAVEIDFQDRFRDEVQRFLDGKAFDMVMGSVHYVFGELMMNDGLFARHGRRKAQEEYFRSVLSMVGTGLFDVVGHLDLVKRYSTRHCGPFEEEAWRGAIGEILREVLSRGMAIEVNSSGLRQAPRSSFPSSATVKLYRSLGGELVTVGSDAHAPGDLARGVDEVLNVLDRAGFRRMTVFRGRRPEAVPVSWP